MDPREKVVLKWACIVALLILGIWLIYMMTDKVEAHEWFPTECCSGRDCKPAELREVTYRAGGWYVASTGDFVPFDDPRIRVSQNIIMYVCKRKSNVTDKSTLYCLFVPKPGG